MHNGNCDCGGGGGCCEKHHGMNRFMEACLLVLLCGGEGHGYALAEELAEFGFAADDLNVSTLYRTLRKMEGSGWVKSDWEQGGKGPKRRVYEITEKGRKELDEWVTVLRARKAQIEKLIKKYQKMLKADQDERST